MTIAPSALDKYAEDIAYVAEKPRAQTSEEFAGQLERAAYNLGTLARINGAEDLETAATFLIEAIDAKGRERAVLLKRALGYLKDVPDMVDEYRGMIGD